MICNVALLTPTLVSIAESPFTFRFRLIYVCDNNTLCCITYAWTLDRWFGYSHPFAHASCGDFDQGFVEPAHYHSLHLQQRAHTSVLAWLCRRVEVIYQMVVSCLDSVSPAGQQDLSMDSQGDEGSSASFESPTGQVR